jgi:4-amino-4-deoxy-L-arabinose transferase-like glycosyltransferase
MLTYSPHTPPTLPKSPEKPWLLLLLCFVWLWPGIFGHAPWKPDEPYTLGVVHWMLHSGDGLVPRIGGVPFLDVPPLYYWVAVGFAKLLSPWLLPLHDAARLATPLFMSLTFLLLGLAGRELLGHRHGRSTVVILLGSLGLIEVGHQLSTNVATLTGFAAAFYGLALALRRGFLGAIALALGSTVLMLSGSLVDVATVWLVALLLPLFEGWRTRQYIKAITIALALGMPLMLAWPLALAKHAPSLYAQWWHSLALGSFYGFGRLGLLHEFGYYLRLLPWFTWPAWPLAGWALWRGRRRLNEARYQLPLLFVGMLLLILVLSPRQNQLYARPLLLPLAILAAAELDSLRRGVAALFNWFGVMALGLASGLMWLGWVAMNFGWPAALAHKAVKYSPTYLPQLNGLAIGLAVVLSAAWVWAVTRKRLVGRQAVTNWAVGMTLLWSLASLLWLPWLDAQKSYASVVKSMQATLLTLPTPNACIATAHHHHLPRALWYYHGDILLADYDTPSGRTCPRRLILTAETPYQPEGEWQVKWQGTRPAEKREYYVLIERPS